MNGQPKLKPHPDVLSIALDAFQGNALNSVMMGDQVPDLDANKRLVEVKKKPLTAIAVTYGYGREEDLAMARPNYLAHSVTELKDTLTRLIYPV